MNEELYSRIIKEIESGRKDFCGEDISGIEFDKDLELKDLNFRGANFQGTIFKGNLENLDFSQANLRGAVFDGFKMTAINFGGADLKDTRFETLHKSKVDLRDADCRNAFSRSHWKSCDFRGANLEGFKFSALNNKPIQFPVDLSSSDFSGMDLKDFDFSFANMFGVNLRNADLSKANLTGTTMDNADLRGARLEDVSFQGVLLYKAELDRDCTNANFKLVWDLQNGEGANRELPGVDLQKHIFHDSNLMNTNLSGSNLSGVSLSKGNLSGANLSDCNLNNAFLNDAKLSGASLKGSEIIKAKMERVNLTSSDLSCANLSNSVLGGSDFTSACLTDLKACNANLSSCNFTGADLTGADLSGAKLTNCRMEGANLQGVETAGANLYGIDFEKVINLPEAIATVLSSTESKHLKPLDAIKAVNPDLEKWFLALYGEEIRPYLRRALYFNKDYIVEGFRVESELLKAITPLIEEERILSEATGCAALSDCVMYHYHAKEQSPEEQRQKLENKEFRKELHTHLNHIYRPATVTRDCLDDFFFSGHDSRVNYQDKEAFEAWITGKCLSAEGRGYLKECDDREREFYEEHKKQRDGHLKTFLKLLNPYLFDGPGSKVAVLLLSENNENIEFVPYCIVGKRHYLFILQHYWL